MTYTRTIALILGFSLGMPLAFAQQRPSRPAESYGKKGQRPAGVPQRPAESWGSHGGQRPANAPQRPAESRGKQGQKPPNAPIRPGR